MENAIIYYDDKGNELARFVFDPSYVDSETVDKALFSAVSSILPVDNSTEDHVNEDGELD